MEFAIPLGSQPFLKTNSALEEPFHAKIAFYEPKNHCTSADNIRTKL